MAAGNITVNQGTQSPILTDTAGGTSIGVVKIDTSAAGTYGSLWSGNVAISSGSVTVTGGTVNVGTVTVTNPTGTTVQFNNGTLNVGTVVNNGGTIDMLKAGTITTLPNIPGGTITNLISGTINSATAVINSATISVLPNLPQGSINITAGTIATLGTMGTLGLVNTVSNITNGSIVVTAGTIAAHAITAATITAGTINTGTINLGTVVGKDASAAARTGNPLAIAGTDGGGTVYAFLTDIKGQQYLGGGTISMLNAGTITTLPNIPGGTITNLISGTINAATAVINSATISVLPNLPQGSINVTAGTIATLGTMGTLGLVNTVTTVSNLTNGSINITAGTIGAGTIGGKAASGAAASGNPVFVGGTATSGSVYGLLTDTSGVLQINGTVSTGGAGTQATRLVDGTLTLGTIVGKDANAAAQTGNPLAFGGTDSGGTMRTVTVDSAGRLTVNSVAAGTTIGTISVGTINTGTINAATITAGTINAGTFVNNGGSVGIFSNIKTASGSITQAQTDFTTASSGYNYATFNISTVAGMSGSDIYVIKGVLQGGFSVNLAYYDTSGKFYKGDGIDGITQTNFNESVGITSNINGFGSVVLSNNTFGASGTTNVYAQLSNSGQIIGNNVVQSGTLSMLNAGTISMLNAGTITTLPNIPGGTITNLVSGTINSATAVLNSGTINVGTFVMPSGTITVLPNLPQGSINVTAGTIATLGTMGTLGLVNTVTTVTTVSNLTNGSVKITTGTVNAGTINTGTINTGTINAGTIQINPLVATYPISHIGTAGTLGIGTLVGTAAIGAGTALYPTNYRIVAISGTPEVILAFGTQVNGPQVIHHGLYPAGGGISSPIPFPHGYGTTASPLTYQILSGAGTVAWDVDYFTHT